VLGDDVRTQIAALVPPWLQFSGNEKDDDLEDDMLRICTVCESWIN
jgi:hypothetical protein